MRGQGGKGAAGRENAASCAVRRSAAAIGVAQGLRELHGASRNYGPKRKSGAASFRGDAGSSSSGKVARQLALARRAVRLRAITSSADSTSEALHARS